MDEAPILAYRGDNERVRAIDRVGRDAKRWWNDLKSEYKTDKTFILKALRSSPTLPSKSDFERQFPQYLRFDRDVVLAFCRREDFAELFEERHLYVPGCLANDKEVMIAYCSKIPRILQEASEELTDDAEVVETAISLGGLELQYASLRLQEDPDIVQRACASHGRALEFCPPGPTRQKLTRDRNFMKDVVLSKPGSGTMWKLMDAELRNDPGVLLQALRNGLCLRDIPSDFKNDSKFLREALRSNSPLYLQLNPQSQAREELAREAILASNSTPEIHEKALVFCPSLIKERLVVLSLCQRGDVEKLEGMLRLPSSDPFVDDLEIMLAAISRKSNLLSLASRRLQLNPEVIYVSLTPSSAWDTIKSLPSAVLRDHPEIATRAVQVSSEANLRYLPMNIPESLWTSNPTLPLAWIRRGGRVLEVFEHILVPQKPYTEENLELPLELVKYNYTEAYKLGDTLLDDEEFITKALTRDGRVLRLASSRLRNNFDLQVLAIANHQRSSQAPASNIQRYFGSYIDLCHLKEKIAKKLDLHGTFVKDFLRGIAIVTPRQAPRIRSQLPMLDRGVETSQAFKRLIAEYLGVPYGPQLRLLRQAMEGLEVAPAPPPLARRNNENINFEDDNSNEAVAEVPQIEALGGGFEFLPRLHEPALRADRGSRMQWAPHAALAAVQGEEEPAGDNLFGGPLHARGMEHAHLAHMQQRVPQNDNDQQLQGLLRMMIRLNDEQLVARMGAGHNDQAQNEGIDFIDLANED